MTGCWFVGITAAVLSIASLPNASHAQGTVQACPNPANCVQVGVTGGNGDTGATVPAVLSFQQAPSDSQNGGPDETAALALTMSLAIAGGGQQTLALADCTRNSDGLPAAVVPNAALSNFKIVVENAFCDGGRTHCLCPASGAADNFINLVVYGPNPLPAPGNPVDIPVLPAGPMEFVTINLKGSSPGPYPLHLYSESVDSQKPQFTAFLSIGDRVAVDQTCVPVQGQPPCSAGATSQVAITDGQIVLGGGGGCMSCVGDCDMSGSVTIDDIIIMVSIAQNARPAGDCTCGDADMSGDIDISEIIQAVTNALGTCTPPQG